jgi:uncharacterized protein YqjF (DUF2071 family)
VIGAVLAAGERLTGPLARDARAQRGGLRETAHRPWPLPAGPWLQGQTWQALLFAHWPLPEDALRALVPEALELDTFDGAAWLGITPFRVSGLRAHGTPPVPPVSRFAETNVRTYVTRDGRPGIWFFSLDAASTLAVLGARAGFGLPYYRAAMDVRRDGDRIDYRTRRIAGPAAALSVTYRPAGAVFQPQPGTLAHFLTERYRLYSLHGGRLRRADIHHPPWPLQPAQAEITVNTMAAPLGLGLTGEPLLHYAHRQDVLVWPPRRAFRSGSGAAAKMRAR